MRFGLFGVATDDHLVSVARHLEAAGGESAFIGREAAAAISYSIDHTRAPVCTIDGYPIEAFDAFYYLPKFLYPHFGATEEWADGYALANEWIAILTNLALLARPRVVNDPVASFLYSRKLPQLQLARSLGLLVPATLLANRADDLATWRKDYPSAIVKPLGKPIIPRLFEEDGQVVVKEDALMTTDLTTDDADMGDLIQSCPHYFQSKIAKDHELRVVGLLGPNSQHFFAFKIQSQSDDLTRTDWRLGTIICPTDFTHLPPELETKLGLFLKQSGLNIGVFDLIVTPDGAPVFLECNPEGTWSWLDIACDGQISGALANLLMETARQ